MHDALKNRVEKAGIPKVDETSWGCGRHGRERGRRRGNRTTGLTNREYSTSTMKRLRSGTAGAVPFPNESSVLKLIDDLLLWMRRGR